MTYLPANNTGVWRLAREGFPVGFFYSPDGLRSPVREGVRLPYALDNGLYHPFGEPPKPVSDRGMVYGALAKIGRKVVTHGWHAPLFAVVPDVPCDGRATLELARRHVPIMRELFPWCPLALAVQDGMTIQDVIDLVFEEARVDWLFVAGSDKWKDRTVAGWAAFGRDHGLKVHMARVNETRRVELARRAGVDTADGTGIWRGDKKQKGRVMRALIQGLMFTGEAA